MDKMTMMQAALKYCELGLPVIPLTPGDKKPIEGFNWKKFQKTSPTPDQIVKWLEKWPNANIGIITGASSGIFAIDFDNPEAKAAWEAKFEQMPPGLSYSTGRGEHYWFKFIGYAQGNKIGIIKDVDLRGEGGYVMVPPSIHPNGKVYTWGNISAIEHGLDELADMPAEMLEFCRLAKNTPDTIPTPTRKESVKPITITIEFDKDKPIVKGISGSTLEWVQEILAKGADKGTRNAYTAKLVGWMVGYYAKNGVTKDEMLPLIVDAIRIWNQRNRPPLADKELMTVIKSIINRHSYEKMSEKIGSPIYNIVCHERMIGDPYYMVYADANKALRCTMQELCNLNLFRPKYAILTDKVIKTMKPDIWYSLIQACLEDKTIQEEEIAESPLILLTSWLYSSAEKNGEEKTKIVTGPVVIDGIVHVTTDAAVRHLQTTSVRKNEWEDVKPMLKKIGFVWDRNQNALNFGGKRIKTWRMPMIELRKVANLDEERHDK